MLYITRRVPPRLLSVPKSVFLNVFNDYNRVSNGAMYMHMELQIKQPISLCGNSERSANRWPFASKVTARVTKWPHARPDAGQIAAGLSPHSVAQ